MAGDFNARTGNKDTSYIKKVPGVRELDMNEGEGIESRLSCDIKVNNYGKKLNSLCKFQNLIIANGRVMGDRVGNFTCHSSRGNSVVDYFISDYDFFKKLKLLKVHEPSFGSIHSPLSLTIDCSFSHEKLSKPPLPKPKKFVWNPSKRGEFIDILKLNQGNFLKCITFYQKLIARKRKQFSF